MVKPDMAKIRERARKLKERKAGNSPGSDSGSDFLRPRVGDNFIWVLPPWDESGEIFKSVSDHWNIPDADGNNSMYRCRKFMANKACRICDILPDLASFKKLDVYGKNNFKNNKSNSPCYQINALNLVKQDDGEFVPERARPYIYKLPVKVYEKILIKMSDLPEGQDDITDPYDGYIVKIFRPEKFTGDNRYEVSLLHPGPREVPIALQYDSIDEYVDFLMNNLSNLDNVFSIPDEEEIDQAVDGMLEYYEKSEGIVVEYSNSSEVMGEEDEVEAPEPEVSEAPKDTSKEEKAEEEETPFDDSFVEIDGEAYAVIGKDKGIATLENEDGDTLFSCDFCYEKVWKTDSWVEKHIVDKHSSKLSVDSNEDEGDSPEEDTKIEESKITSKNKESIDSPPGSPSCFGNYGDCSDGKKEICRYSEECKEVS